MNKRDELIEKYASDLKEKCQVTPEMELLKKITIGCGPSIYNKDSSMVSSTDQSELNTVRENFLIKKLGLSNNDKLDEGINKVVQHYGHSNRHKYRVVVYCLLTKYFGKESVYK